jgi:hypothetical protein
MTDSEIIARLWDAANLITGFVAVQALAFTYACAGKEFGDAINTRAAKRTILVVMGAMSIGYCLAVAWCSFQEATLDPQHSRLYWHAAVGRSLFIVAITGFSFIVLYARQLFLKQPYRG